MFSEHSGSGSILFYHSGAHLRRYLTCHQSWSGGKVRIYQIYVSSFYDSNGDGIGDLRGVIDKLDYIYNLGLKSIWLSPFYPSGGKDGGYDVTSFTEIDPVYGSMNDFDSLVEKVHEKGMHILVDFVPNHTSNQHHWFKESSKNNDPNNPYRDYYVWYASEDKVNPPNNWVRFLNRTKSDYLDFISNLIL